MEPSNSDAICDQLYQLCVDHQTYLEKRLHKALDCDFSIGYDYSEYAIKQLYNGEELWKPTKLIIYVWEAHMDKEKLNKIQQIVKNYDIIEELRCSLIDRPIDLVRESHQKLIDFNAIFSSEETRQNLRKEPQDSCTKRFLEKIAHLLTSVFGADLISSLRSKNKFAFWRSQEEVVLNKIEHLLEPVSDAPNQNQIMSQ